LSLFGDVLLLTNRAGLVLDSHDRSLENGQT